MTILANFITHCRKLMDNLHIYTIQLTTFAMSYVPRWKICSAAAIRNEGGAPCITSRDNKTFGKIRWFG